MADNATASGLNARLTQTASSLVTYSVTHDPILDQACSGRLTDLAHEMGNEDGSENNAGPHTAHVVMPHERFISGVLDQAAAGVGREVDRAMQAARQGQPLNTAAPDRESTVPGRVWSFLRRHTMLGVAIVVVSVIEFLVGTVWTQRVFGLSDFEAEVAAFLIPVAMGVLGVVIGTVVARNRSRLPLVEKVLGVGAFIGFVVMIVCAGLVLSGSVDNPVATTGGFSGGADGAPTVAASSETAYELTKLGTYVGLSIFVLLMIIVMHAMDIDREVRRRKLAAAEAQMAKATTDQVAHGNIAYLQQFLSLVNELRELREQVIESYRAGVLETLAPDVQWPAQGLELEWQEPEWAERLRTELQRLTDA